MSTSRSTRSESRAGSPQVVRRLCAALEDLLTIAPQERKSSLREQLELVKTGAQVAINAARERNRLTFTPPLINVAFAACVRGAVAASGGA